MAQTALERGVELLRGTRRFEPGVLDAFARHMVEAPEEALFRMNPLRHARAAGLDERVAVDLFLYATHAGLLEFSWGVLCPYCRGFLTTPGALRSLQRSRTCGLCDCAVPTEDDNLEVAFTVAPSVRRLRFHSPETLDFAADGLRMIFSPSLSVPPEVEEALRRNIVASARAPAGEVLCLPLTLEPGAYRMAVPAQHAWLHLQVKEGGQEGPIEVDLAEGHLVPGRLQVAPGRTELRLHNRTGQTVIAGISRVIEGKKLRELAPLERFFSGKRMVTTQAFRDLFRSASIPSEGGLEFKSLTVLFTDLKGSTELYERIGDFRAYELVRQHFDVLKRIIDEAGGSMVKTIGDAIMASFSDVEGAMAAATRMREEIGRVGEGQLSLKVGLHTGPCIAVALNEQLDYFGQTVNVAARVQNLAGGGEIVCTAPVWSAAGVQQRIERAGLTATPDRAQLKGVAQDVTVYRLAAG